MGGYLVRDVHIDVRDFVCEHVTTTTENSSIWSLPRGSRCQISSTQLYYIRRNWRPAWWAC